MSYLLDTNVVCEVVKPHPNKSVVSWLNSVQSSSVFISVLTIGEIRRGIEKLPDGKRRRDLLVWLENDIPAWFGSHMLPVDLAVADRWGFITAHQPEKIHVSAIDTLLAATALAYNLKVATRNTKDFQVPGLETINPFE